MVSVMWFSIPRSALGIVYNKMNKILYQYELSKNQLYIVNECFIKAFYLD